MLGEQGDAQQAAVLMGAAAALREGLNSHHSPADRVQYETTVEAIRGQLSVPAFEAAWSRGRALRQQEALWLAQTVEARQLPVAAVTDPAALSTLTRREKEVLQLVAAGLSNAEIASRLIISQHTVSTHLRTIYDKLGVHSRSAATRFALEHGL